MPTITILSTKGGTGKTTIAIHLAVAAAAQGCAVHLVDTDPQQSALLWSKLRTTPFTVRKTPRPSGINIVDTPPARGPGLIKYPSDLIIIPCTPSALDLMGIRASLKAVQSTPTGFVLNRCIPRVPETQDALIALKEYKYPILGQLGNRIIYSRALLSGLTAQEYQPRSVAAQEVLTLWRNVKHLL